MVKEAAILDQWFAETVSAYAGESLRFLATEPDPFRNPIGQTLKQGLATLLQGVLHGGNPPDMQSALAEILRLQAVQGLTASQATGFVLGLRPLLRQLPREAEVEVNQRIDQLALLAFEEYVRCREKLFEIRWHESRRTMAVPAIVSQARS